MSQNFFTLQFFLLLNLLEFETVVFIPLHFLLVHLLDLRHVGSGVLLLLHGIKLFKCLHRIENSSRGALFQTFDHGYIFLNLNFLDTFHG